MAPSAEPAGDLLPEVITEALRQGAALLASPPSSSSSSRSQAAALTAHGNSQEQGDKLSPPSPPLLPFERSRDGEGDARKLGDAIVAGLSVRAERSGWNTSVLFLEKTGAVRLRLIRRSEEKEVGGSDKREGQGL